MNSPIEKEFEKLMIKHLLCEGMHKEYRYYKFRFDFAWPARKIAVEMQSKQYHHTPTQLERDRWKLNIAQSNGWLVFQFSTLLLRKKPHIIVGILRKTLTWR